MLTPARSNCPSLMPHDAAASPTPHGHDDPDPPRTDPRLADVGGRCVLPGEKAETALTAAGFSPTEPGEYDHLRLRLGLPDGSRDLISDKSILLESGFEELNGVDWDKGCFMGQELTARTKYRGCRCKSGEASAPVQGPVA